MGRVRAVWKLVTSWYVSLLLFGAAGALVGAIVFFTVFPGQPKIGIIDIPFTVISDDSAFVIGEYLNYARENDSIKAVVIKINSPGGGAAASEKLFLETRKLREKKPVVIAMSDIVASGGYMMSLGANYTYTLGSSLVPRRERRRYPRVPGPPDSLRPQRGDGRDGALQAKRRLQKALDRAHGPAQAGIRGDGGYRAA